MSQIKPWTLRTVLALSTTTFALCFCIGTSLAAGHEGMAGMRAGAGGAGGDVRSINERFDSMRVESLSPAGYAAPGTNGAGQSRAVEPGQSGHALIRDPLVQPPQPAGSSGHRLIRDPVMPRTAAASAPTILPEAATPPPRVANYHRLIRDPVVPRTAATSTPSAPPDATTPPPRVAAPPKVGGSPPPSPDGN